MFVTAALYTDNRAESLEWLATAVPGPELSSALANLDLNELSMSNRVFVMIAQRHLASHYMGEVYRSIAAVEVGMRDAGDEYHVAVENTAAEVGAALVLTRRSAEAETHLALELTRRLPQVLWALLCGDIDERRARVLARGTEHLPAETAERVVHEVIDDATRLTTGQLAARLSRICITNDPEAADMRYRRSLDDRRIYADPTPQGTANLLALDLPPDRVTAFTRYLDRAARGLRRHDTSRTMDQLRSDIFLDIINGTHTGLAAGQSGGVHLEVDLATLAELNEAPGELAGYAAVVADVARQVAINQVHTEWSFTATDPQTGDIVCTGTTKRRPTRSQQRELTSRYRRCVWPGCRMPSVDCDLDHRTPWGHQGCTHNHNLAPVCRHHHRIRHQANWSYRRLPNGDHEWTSQLGHSYATSGRSP